MWGLFYYGELLREFSSEDLAWDYFYENCYNYGHDDSDFDYSHLNAEYDVKEI